MPRINTHYVSGSFDEPVYRAADAAEMPASVSSGFDRGAFVWRWASPPKEGGKMCEVLLRLGPASAGSLNAEVGVLASTASLVPHPPKWRSISQSTFLTAVGIDEEWLAEHLGLARKLALTLQ